MEPVEPAPPSAGGWIARLWPFFRRHRRKVAVALTGSIVGQSVNALSPLIQKVIIDDAILSSRRALVPWIGLLLATALVSFGATFVRRQLGGSFGLAVQHDLRDAVYRHVQRLDTAGDASLGRGELVSRATADITLVQTLLSQLHVLLGNTTLVLVGLVSMIFLSPLLSVVVLVCLPPLALVAARLRSRVFPSVWYDQRCQAEIAGLVEESTSGFRLVRAFVQEERMTAELVRRARELYGSRLRTARINAAYNPTMQLLPQLGQWGALLFGGWLAIRGTVSVGTFVAFASYLVQLASPVRMLANAVATAQQARAGALRVLELLDATPPVTDRPGAPDLLVDRGRVEIDDVSFAYRPSEPLLDRFSLRVEPGERVAIVGASGSGKSTLALLLPRFYDPAAGAIRIDGTDVRDVTLASLRRSVGVVFEESFLFADTIAANIAYGRPDAGPAAIERAARAAGAHAFIAELPQGYDTPVAEVGHSLSGGQRQRIALARALLTDPAVLVLDDATSAIDARTEEEIHRSLRTVLGGRTTILIAHRLSTLRLADRTVVMEHGRVIASGTHEELLATCPAYRDLLQGPDFDLDDRAEALRLAHEAVAPLSPADPTSVDPRAWPTDVDADTTATAAPARFNEVAVVGTDRATAATAAAVALADGSILDQVARLPRLRDDVGDADERAAAETGPFALRRFLRRYRAGLALAAALVVVDSATTLAGPLLIGWGIDEGVRPGSMAAVALAAAVFLVVQVLSWVNARALAVHVNRTAERMLFALRVRVFRTLQHLPTAYFEREAAGRIMARATSDIEALAQLLQQGIVTAVAALLHAAGVLVVLAVLEPRLALVAALVVPLLAGATEWFRRASVRAHEQARERLAVVYADFQEGLAGLRVTQALGREERNANRFREASGRYFGSRVAAVRYAALYFPLIQLLSTVAKALVLVAGSVLVHDGTLAIGVLVAFLLYLDQLFAPIQQFSQIFDQWLQARTSLRRIEEVLAEPWSTPVDDRSSSAPPLPRFAGELAFDHLSFAYPGSAAVTLDDLDLTVPAGQTVAIVGPTGAGKSTLMKLLARFEEPTRGQLRIDGTPVRAIDVFGYRRQLGYVPQEPFLFAGTVRDNIAFGRPEATPVEVETAARRVGAHEAIAALPQGYLTPVRSHGTSLSAGQRQLVCLARASLVDPSVLLLDEATAYLDLASEARVQRAMRALARGRTTVLIAHRLQTTRHADRVLVIDRGRVVEDGSPTELLGGEGPYADLWAVSHGDDKQEVAP